MYASIPQVATTVTLAFPAFTSILMCHHTSFYHATVMKRRIITIESYFVRHNNATTQSHSPTMVLVNSKKPAAGLSKLLMADRRDATRLFIYMENDGDDDDDDDDDGVDVAPAA
ncbi:hypothetical protein V6N13_044425 [Hibiscus sabdariffa]